MEREPEKLDLLDISPGLEEFREDLLEGLRQPQKQVSSKYLYDQRGSVLFDRICEVDEYYPTRTESQIMRDNADQMADAIGPESMIVEYGSGSSIKTHILLDCLDQPRAYVPIDICRDHLMQSSARIADAYPDLEVLSLCADFTAKLELPEPQSAVGRRVVFFPGSTIGNLTQETAEVCLTNMRENCGDDGGVLIGVDLEKDTDILRAAYNDAAGVTAAFNLNLLERINRELDADFDLDVFDHQAVFNAERTRMEMHLRSLANQTVRVGDETVSFAKGETIHTENSHKYSLDRFRAMAANASLSVKKVWTDEKKLFSVQYLRAS